MNKFSELLPYLPPVGGGLALIAVICGLIAYLWVVSSKIEHSVHKMGAIIPIIIGAVTGAVSLILMAFYTAIQLWRWWFFL